MASAGNKTQNTKNKAPQSPEQRKQLYMGLGAGGIILLLAGGLLLPRLLAKPTAVPVSPTAVGNTVTTPPVTDGTDGAVPAVAPAPVASTPGGRVATLLPSRSDPFQQLYFIPTPTPVPPPIPPPVSVPTLGEVTPILLPQESANQALLQQPLNLPPVAITRLDEASRRPVDAFPPARTAGGDGGGSANPASNRRLSGVILGEGVRALLEIQGPTGTVTRVVQPGDETDGITVLSIQRIPDGTNTITRMIIRENGEERSVDLRAGAPQAAGGPGGPGAMGGPFGAP